MNKSKKKTSSNDQIYIESFEHEIDLMIAEILGGIIAKRINEGLTQEDVAKKTGLKQSAIARFENFSTMPRMDTLLKIVKAVDFDFCTIKVNDSVVCTAKETENDYCGAGACKKLTTKFAYSKE
jgi:Predicted transcriptional regulator with C-terminal CBS domains